MSSEKPQTIGTISIILTYIVVSLLAFGCFAGAEEEPPLEESTGLSVTSNVETVHPDNEDMWRYRLYLEPDGDYGVELKNLTIKVYTYKKEYITTKNYGEEKMASLVEDGFLGANQNKGIGFGLPSKNDIHFRDHIFTGINEQGDEVKGVCRVRFSKEEKEDAGPPEEEEFLARSDGIEVTVNKETVHPDEEGMWRYTLKIKPSGDFGITVKEMTTKAFLYDGRYLTGRTYQEDSFEEWWGDSYIRLGNSKSFRSGLPSRNDIHFRDHIFTGVNDIGEEVVGTVRVHFSKDK